MKRIAASIAIAALILPSTAIAQNVGKCGWGSKLFHGQKGLAPQVLAVTTNGTSGNQTFAMTFGTSGCSQNGVVTSSWKTAAYIDGNMTKLARDISRGEGEALAGLAHVVRVAPEHTETFASVLKNEYSRLFPTEETTASEVLLSLKDLLSENSELAQYSKTL